MVNWADEEGTRFGRSLLGCSAATGALSLSEFTRLRAADGTPATEVVRPFGFQLSALCTPVDRLAAVVAAAELHIEQGPVLEQAGRPCAAVSGCLGVERWKFRFAGRSGHAGATPMALRHDPLRAAAQLIAEVMELAEARDALATVGEIRAFPQLATVIPAQVEMTLDLRHRDLASLGELRELALARARGADLDRLFFAAPVRFDPGLVKLPQDACGGGQPLVSGPLHDSVSLARSGIPAVMVFVASRGGVSHTRDEDTAESDLRAGLLAFADLVSTLLSAHIV